MQSGGRLKLIHGQGSPGRCTERWEMEPVTKLYTTHPTSKYPVPWAKKMPYFPADLSKFSVTCSQKNPDNLPPRIAMRWDYTQCLIPWKHSEYVYRHYHSYSITLIIKYIPDALKPTLSWPILFFQQWTHTTVCFSFLNPPFPFLFFFPPSYFKVLLKRNLFGSP